MQAQMLRLCQMRAAGFHASPFPTNPPNFNTLAGPPGELTCSHETVLGWLTVGKR